MASILVVDDSADDRHLIATLGAHRGHVVLEAERGDDGLTIARGTRPDLVISDLLMPGLDGFELARAIRTDPDLTAVRVVFCTGASDDPQFRELALRCGVGRVIPKPSEPQLILAAIDEILASPAEPPIPGTTPLEFERDHLTMLTEALGRKVEELKQANDDLRRGEARFRALLESAPEAIVGVDRAGRVTLVNALAVSLFGYARDELLGQEVEVLVPHVSHEVHRGNRERYLRSPSVRPMGVGLDLEAQRKDGTRFPVSVALSTIDTGDDLVVLAAVTDITDRLAAMRERQALEAQLHHAQRMESIGQLAGGVAHDFNNLLAVIINSAHFAAEAADPGSPQAEDIQEILVAGGRAADLTRQLLLFSRVEPSLQDQLDLASIVTELTGMLRRLIEEHISLEIDLAVGLPAVLADRSKLEQVILNLVVNARDAMPRGGTVRISAAPVDLDDHADLAAGRYVWLQVADTGTGIDEEALGRVFEPFFTTKQRGRGTGLGLSTVYGVVRQAGGDVAITSEPGVGTTVSVYLPAASAQDVAVQEPAVDPAGLTGSERVLIVEDEDGVRAIVQRMLTRYGYQVSIASLPSEALALVDAGAEQPDLVLADVIMPEMSGPELVAGLREAWPDLTAIFMSGYTGGQTELPPGAVLLYKPFDAEALARAVRSALDDAPT